jgi:hypothetical protein
MPHPVRKRSWVYSDTRWQGERPEEQGLRNESKERADKGRRASRKAEGDESTLGWGVSAESDDDEFFVRRAIFSLIAAVVVCMGAWMLLTTLAGQDGAAEDTLLTATVGSLHTVRLRTIDRTQVQAFRRMVRDSAMQQLAGGHEFLFLPYDGRVAVCVGRFDEPDAPGAAQLLGRFREVSTASGRRPFQDAEIWHYSG